MFIEGLRTADVQVGVGGGEGDVDARNEFSCLCLSFQSEEWPAASADHLACRRGRLSCSTEPHNHPSGAACCCPGRSGDVC